MRAGKRQTRIANCTDRASQVRVAERGAARNISLWICSLQHCLDRLCLLGMASAKARCEPSARSLQQRSPSCHRFAPPECAYSRIVRTDFRSSVAEHRSCGTVARVRSQNMPIRPPMDSPQNWPHSFCRASNETGPCPAQLLDRILPGVTLDCPCPRVSQRSTRKMLRTHRSAAPTCASSVPSPFEHQHRQRLCSGDFVMQCHVRQIGKWHGEPFFSGQAGVRGLALVTRSTIPPRCPIISRIEQALEIGRVTGPRSPGSSRKFSCNGRPRTDAFLQRLPPAGAVAFCPCDPPVPGDSLRENQSLRRLKIRSQFPRLPQFRHRLCQMTRATTAARTICGKFSHSACQPPAPAATPAA